MSSYSIAAAVALFLAAFAANLSTERAQPSLNPALGWALVSGLFAFAVFALSQNLGLAVSVALALTALMACIPAVSACMGWRQRQIKDRHGR